MKISLLLLFLLCNINNALAWIEIETDDVSVECSGNNCYADVEDYSNEKDKKMRVTTAYSKDLLAMPQKSSKNNDPMAMPKGKKRNPKDPMAF